MIFSREIFLNVSEGRVKIVNALLAFSSNVSGCTVPVASNLQIANISGLLFSSFSNFHSSDGSFNPSPFDSSMFEIQSSPKELLDIKETSFFCKKPESSHLTMKKRLPFEHFSSSPKKNFNLKKNSH